MFACCIATEVLANTHAGVKVRTSSAPDKGPQAEILCRHTHVWGHPVIDLAEIYYSNYGSILLLTSQFNRPSSCKSQYRYYLDYVRIIGEEMGFVVEEDSLRIPSSKRVRPTSSCMFVACLFL